MNKLFRIWVVLMMFALGLAGRAGAQEISHQVNFPSGDAAWSVSFETGEDYGQDSAPKPKPNARQMSKIDIVRMGDLRHDILTWSDGNTTEYWWEPKLQVVLLQDNNDTRVHAAKAGNMDASRFDDSLFTWVSASTFKGLKPFHGTLCRTYGMDITTLMGEVIHLRAWIDNKTGRPLAWSNSGIINVFSFDQPLPQTPLVLPPNFQATLTQVRAFMNVPKPVSANGL